MRSEPRGRLSWAASFFFAAWAALCPPPAAAQDNAAQAPVALSLDQARAVAQQAAIRGDLQVADALSTALLDQDPDDPVALLVRAVVARGVGDLNGALDNASRAYSGSDNDALRFDAAMLAADVQTRQGHFTRAQVWLRRADQVAPDDQRRQLVARAYRQVAQQNPLSLQFRISARPSNNVNNGAETDTIEIGGLPFVLDASGTQLGGYEASVGASLGYRLSESETHRSEFLGEVFLRRVWLDSDAKTKAPDAKGSDFDYAILLGGLRYSTLVWPELGPSSITGLVGQSWYGGDALARWGELQLRQVVRRGADSQLDFGGAIREEKRLDDGINSNTSLSLSADLVRRVEGGRWSFGAAIKNVWSDSATVDHFSTTLRGVRAWNEVAGLRPTLRASIEQRIYHKFSTAPDGREDLSVSIGVDVVRPDIAYFGFTPQLSVQVRRTLSDVDIYDRNEYSIGLTAVSRF